MTRKPSDRYWLLKIHSINHRVEFTVKDAFLETRFEEIDTFYSSIFYLSRDSGKVKTVGKNAAEAMEIQHYNLSKISGTCCVEHCH